MEEARKNGKRRRAERSGHGGRWVRPLCREIFIHGCTHNVFFSSLSSATDHDVVPFAVDGGGRGGFSSRRRRRGGRKTFWTEAGEISLASLRFGIHGSWGALRTWFSQQKSRNFFFRSFSSGSSTRRTACNGEYLLGNLSSLSVGNPTPCSRVSLRNLVVAALQADFFFFFYIARISFCTSVFLLIL